MQAADRRQGLSAAGLALHTHAIPEEIWDSLQGGVYEGNLYAIPISMNSWALYYNKGIMNAAGITR